MIGQATEMIVVAREETTLMVTVCCTVSPVAVLVLVLVLAIRSTMNLVGLQRSASPVHGELENSRCSISPPGSSWPRSRPR